VTLEVGQDIASSVPRCCRVSAARWWAQSIRCMPASRPWRRHWLSTPERTPSGSHTGRSTAASPCSSTTPQGCSTGERYACSTHYALSDDTVLRVACAWCACLHRLPLDCLLLLRTYMVCIHNGGRIQHTISADVRDAGSLGGGILSSPSCCGCSCPPFRWVWVCRADC
jgi:hypothetical protein